MVPCKTVPFFSSTCTVSLDSFIRNLRGQAGAVSSEMRSRRHLPKHDGDHSMHTEMARQKRRA